MGLLSKHRLAAVGPLSFPTTAVLSLHARTPSTISLPQKRFVNVFDVAASEEPPPEPVCTLGFAATPAFLALHASAGEKGAGNKSNGDQVTVVAGFDTGGVSVFRTRRQAGGKGARVLDWTGLDSSGWYK